MSDKVTFIHIFMHRKKTVANEHQIRNLMYAVRMRYRDTNVVCDSQAIQVIIILHY